MNDKKVILVTGASKGIGFEIVRQLSRLGHTVILTARNEESGLTAQDLLRNERLIVDFLHLDITIEESIRTAFNEVKASFGKLDVLINNAAILSKQDLSILKNDLSLLKNTVDSNAYSHLMVSRIFYPIIPTGGRIIMTSSDGGSMSVPVVGWSPAYCVSKSFLNAITRHLAYELSSRGISVNAFDPGWVKTDMGGRTAPGSVEQGADTAVWLATKKGSDTGKIYHLRKEISW
jgi:NAD(P)-dependent dehydrogenase (short-subunit alcohol dehydrogenase family)